MYGFGMFNNIDALKHVTSLMEGADLVPSDEEMMTDEENAKLDNVDVPMLADDSAPYTKGSDGKVSGASGNKPEEDSTKEPYPQMELGIGSMNMGIKKEMSRMESFNGTTDEAPMEDASDVRQKNVIEKVEDLFNNMYGKSYEKKSKEKDPKFDYDFTKPNVVLDNTSMFKVKKGW